LNFYIVAELDRRVAVSAGTPDSLIRHEFAPDFSAFYGRAIITDGNFGNANGLENSTFRADVGCREYKTLSGRCGKSSTEQEEKVQEVSNWFHKRVILIL